MSDNQPQQIGVGRIALIILGAFVIISVIIQLNKAQEAQRQEQVRTQLREKIETDRPTVLKELDAIKISKDRYERADEYLAAKDDVEIRSIRNKARTKWLLSNVSITPTSNTSKMIELYRELSEINPKNSKFKRLLKKYQAKADKQEKRRNRRIASFGKPPIQSGWDGTYHVVKSFLKSAAKDPDSIKLSKCTDVKVDDKEGWLVGCEYFGKNSFGATVRNSNWFIVKHNKVTKKYPISAYKY